MLDDVDLLVCGAGPVGCVVAERAANVLGWKVLVVDRRPHIAGNCHDRRHQIGVLIHQYGPHYFRTSDESLLAYLSRFAEFIPAAYEVKSLVRGRLFPFPINLTTLEMFFNRRLDAGSAEQLLAGLAPSNRALQLRGIRPGASRQGIIRSVLSQLYDQTVGRRPRPGTAGVRANSRSAHRDNRLRGPPFAGDAGAGLPRCRPMLATASSASCSTATFRRCAILIRPRATVYTGPVDEYFHCRLGAMPYRSLQFDFVSHKAEYVQPCVQINYPNDFPFIRSVEIKHVTRQKHPRRWGAASRRRTPMGSPIIRFRRRPTRACTSATSNWPTPRPANVECTSAGGGPVSLLQHATRSSGRHCDVFTRSSRDTRPASIDLPRRR